MKKLVTLSLGLIVAACVSNAAIAEDATDAHLKSGVCEGNLPAFTVTKVAGAEDDGVSQGETLCYRCRNQNRPQVVVFTRSTDPQVGEMIQKLEAAMAEHQDEQLRVFVNVLGSDKESATKAAQKFASMSGTKNIPFVVPTDVENGPKAYQLNPEAAITVTLAADSTVVASHGFASGSDICIDTVMNSVASIVK